MFSKIKLPHPTKKTLDIALDISNNCPINCSSIEWHKKIQQNDINIVSGSFIRRPDLTFQIILEYQKIFTHKILPTVAILENSKVDSPAFYPPHSDRTRHVALNYYIELGGDQVQTTFYEKFDDPTDKQGGYVLPYNSIPIANTIITEKNIWYSFNSRQYHSVENILTKRIMISLMIDIDHNTFIKTYSHLLY